MTPSTAHRPTSSSDLDRRDFLRGVAGAAGATLLPAWLRAQSARLRVVVVGAGLAGLSAAYELMRRGHSVTVVEARPHAGGRVFTLRSPWDDKLYAEAGGEWVHPNHTYMLHYIKEFGMELVPDEGEKGFWDNGKFFSGEEAEKGIPGHADLRKKIAEHVARIDIFENPERSALARLDGMTYADWLRSLGASDAAIARYRIGVNDLMTVDVTEISALHMLYEYALPMHDDVTESRIRGGNTRLPEAFSHALTSRIRYNSPVTKVYADPRGARVNCGAGRSGFIVEADHVIIAIPGTEISRLSFEPELPPDTARAYQAIGLGRIMKVVLQTRTRFWEKHRPPLQGVETLREAQSVYHSSNGQPGPRGLLTNYVAGWGADAWAPLGYMGQMAAARKLTGEIWKQPPTAFERSMSWHWNVQKWTRGSYAFFAPGQMTSVRPVVAQPVDRIHFAGEHTAVWQGYMNGAVESGLRAASEVDPGIRPLFDQLTQQAKAYKSPA